MKEKIIQESILLFERKGFSETSIQDIMDAIGATKGTFYYYFSSKEQLLMDIHIGYIDDLLERQATIYNTSATNREKLDQMVKLLIADIKEHGPSGRVFFREMRHLAEANAGAVKAKREEFRINIEKLLAEGIEKGEFRKDVKPDMAAFAVLGITNWSYQWFNPAGEVSAESLAEIYSDLILNGIS